MRCHLGILDLGLTLIGPDSVVEPIATAYRRFALDTPRSDSVTLEMADGEGRSIVADGRRSEPIRGVDPTAQLYQVFLDLLMDRLGSHALLHAAALRSPSTGGVLLLAAPSGHGKSSMALELTRRGFDFFGDDYAPLDLERRLVHPYPRAVALTDDAAARMRDSLTGPDVKLMGKRLVDVGELLGEERLADGPAPLRHIVLLSASLEGLLAPFTTVRLAARNSEAERLDAAFAATPGVDVDARRCVEEACYWQLRIDHSRSPTGAVADVLEGDNVLFVEKFREEKPDFTAAPASRPVPRREAAELLGRELLNRRSGGRLLERYGGSLTALFVDLAGALRETHCHRVQVGERGATAAVIADLASSVDLPAPRQ